MVQKIKNNNLAEYRAFQEEKNKELVLKSIKYIKSLNGIINFSTVSQVTYDIADPLKNEKGLTAAENDIGIVTLPGGKSYALSIFVSDSMESAETNTKMIADISKIVFDYFSKK